MSADAELRVRAFLRERGVAQEEIDVAAREDRLHLLVVDTVLVPQEAEYTPLEVAELSGMPIELIERFWRALGFPNPARDVRAFGPLDVEALSTVQGLLAFRMTDTDSALQLARVIGSSMARIADAEITASPVLRGGDDSAETAELFSMTADATLPGMARLLEYSWRRHLQAAARRAMTITGVFDSGTAHAMLAVGFVDLVGFTVLSQQLTEKELGEMVGRFEALAYDTVTVLGGRVVKMIGDEAMYVAPDVEKAAEIAVSLSEAYSDDEVLSEVRVGLAFGGVLVRDGDYYGPVVNLASRIVNIATPGSVLTSDEVHTQLADAPAFEWRSLRPRFLKDIGRVPLWRLQRAGVPAAERRDRPKLFRLPRPDMRLAPEKILERVERLIPPVGRDPE
ncbi:MAG TPA: adenylate cyclase regulatory domain-containing protein [Acidimicrobiales bacterium]|nr:adenylate cyclase regulatory domain-containing protein [Acidimicrobiales bacterium]